MRDEIEKILSIIARRYPLIYATISEFDIIETREVRTAATDGLRIFINPEFFWKLDTRRRILLLLHEALHAAYQHPGRAFSFLEKLRQRGIYLDPLLANIAADAIVDRYLRELTGSGNDAISDGGITLSRAARLLGIPEQMLEKLPLEGILYALVKMITSSSSPALASLGIMAGDIIDVRRGDQLGGRGTRVYVGRLSRTGLYRRVRRLIGEGRYDEAAGLIAASIKAGLIVVNVVSSSVRAGDYSADAGLSHGTRVSSELKAGIGKGAFIRVIDELEKGRIDWNRLLRARLASLSTKVRRSWSRINKKIPVLRPGILFDPRIERVLAVIDVSGSISDELLKKFTTVIADAIVALNPRRVRLVWFDYGVRRVFEGPPSLARKALMEGSPGRGGTSIRESLEDAVKYVRRYGRGVLVIVASDFYTIESVDEVVEMLARVRRLGALVAIVVPPYAAILDRDDVDLKAVEKAADEVILLPVEDPFERVRV